MDTRILSSEQEVCWLCLDLSASMAPRQQLDYEALERAVGAMSAQIDPPATLEPG